MNTSVQFIIWLHLGIVLLLVVQVQSKPQTHGTVNVQANATESKEGSTRDVKKLAANAANEGTVENKRKSKEGEEKRKKNIPSGEIHTWSMTMDSPPVELVWAQQRRSAVVFAISDKGTLYRSADEGNTWTEQSSTLEAAQAPLQVHGIHISPVDHQVIFFQGANGKNFFSTDDGKTYQTGATLNIQNIQFHPTMRSWLLAEASAIGCGTPHKQPCRRSLFISMDLGKSWKLALKKVERASWDPFMATESHKRIYATVDHKGRYLRSNGWDKHVHFVMSDDFFNTEKVVKKHGNHFIFDKEFTFVAAAIPGNPDETPVQLFVNADRLKHLDLKRAHLPTLHEHSYTLLDASTGSVFLHVKHRDIKDAGSGSIFISDASGTNFVLSLPNNIQNQNGKCAFHKVKGLEGIYIANYEHLADSEGKAINKWKDSDDDGENDGNEEGRYLSRRSDKKGETRTVISFDKGASWRYIRAPSYDVFGKEFACQQRKDCTLHLHGADEELGPLYSVASAIGIIMSTGVVGNHLHQSITGVGTFLSSDGGVSWKEVARGSHIYAFGDHGGLIVMAKDSEATDSIQYSWDQGNTWTLKKISDKLIEIDNIIVEPSATSPVFVVYGWADSKGVIVSVNFSNLHERECAGSSAAGAPESDYELWTPMNDGDQCLMGRKISYLRRKPNAACLNPSSHESQHQTSHCTCVEADFECDVGYHRVIDGGPCVFDKSSGLPMVLEQPDTCSDSFRVSKGYRRIPGDSCVGGDAWDPVHVPCASLLFSHNRVGHALLSLLVALLIVTFGVSVSAKSGFFGRSISNMMKRFGYIRYSALRNRAPNTDDVDFDSFGGVECEHATEMFGEDDDLLPEEEVLDDEDPMSAPTNYALPVLSGHVEKDAPQLAPPNM